MNLDLLKRYGKKRRMMKVRALAHYLASVQGWFWLPCPFCGEKFAGFETASGSVAITPEGMYGTCSKSECVAKGEVQYREMLANLKEWQAVLNHR